MHVYSNLSFFYKVIKFIITYLVIIISNCPLISVVSVLIPPYLSPVYKIVKNLLFVSLLVKVKVCVNMTTATALGLVCMGHFRPPFYFQSV